MPAPSLSTPAVLFALAVAGCNGSAGTSALVSLVDEPAGANCADGGTAVSAGTDTNGNGTLDAAEVTSTSYICNGSAADSGQGGANAGSVLTQTSDEPAGANCADGGTRIDVGVDDDADGALDTEEVDSTAYVCDDAANCFLDDDRDGAGGRVGFYDETGACAVEGYVPTNTDCDDTDALIFPGAPETVPGIDQDCDGDIVCYVDADADGYGAALAAYTVEAVHPDLSALGCAALPGDCDETNDAINPAAADVALDGTDADCDDDDDAYPPGDYGTALAQQYSVATFVVRGGTFVSANVGKVYAWGVANSAWESYAEGSIKPICDFRGTLAYVGPADTPNCPECEWSFALGPVSGSTGGGALAPTEDCEGRLGLTDGALDTFSGYDWAFTQNFDFYGDSSLFLDETILIGNGTDWYPFAFNYGDGWMRNVQTSGAAWNVLQLEYGSRMDAEVRYGEVIYSYEGW